MHGNLEHFLCGESFVGNLHLSIFDALFTVLFSTDEYNYGKSSRIWAATLSDAFTWKRDSVPMKRAPKDAISFDALPTTLENLNGRMQSMPLTVP
jgi:hypothetical protein